MSGDDDTREPLLTKGSEMRDPTITRQMWIVFAVAYLGWALDMFDATLYTIVQTPALEELLGTTSKTEVAAKGGMILSFFLIGAAIGGVLFGVLADEYGRARMMMVTVLIYSIGTALCSLAHTWWQLLILRAVTGVGTGGEWACGASLVSEVWPDQYRTTVAPLLQSGAGFGFLLAGVAHYAMSPHGWRAVFLIGLLPALLSLALRLLVDESEMWRQAASRRKEAKGDDKGFANGHWETIKSIFRPPHRQDTLALTVCMLMMNFVYWSTAAWVPSIVRDLIRDFPDDNKNWDGDSAATVAVMTMNVGAILGAVSWIFTADRYGRKPVFAVFLAGQMTVIPPVFAYAHRVNDFVLLMPICGFLLSGIYGGMPLYLPEIYPTSIRATGSSFVFNVGRLFAAAGTMTMGSLVGSLGSYYEAAAIMPLFSIVTLVAFQFPRETRGCKLE